MYLDILLFDLTFHDKGCTFNANKLVSLSMEVTASIFRNILYAAQSKGADLSTMCEKIGFKPSELDNSEKRFDLVAVDALFEHGIDLTNDPLFRLHMGNMPIFQLSVF